MNEKKRGKKLFDIDENNEFIGKNLVPPLKLCESPKRPDPQPSSSSLTFRLKKRNQVHKSLDFKLNSSQILTPRVIKADHQIPTLQTPKALTCRKPGSNLTITFNNRRVARNLLLDSFPV
jgi:hypothetical protein